MYDIDDIRIGDIFDYHYKGEYSESTSSYLVKDIGNNEGDKTYLLLTIKHPSYRGKEFSSMSMGWYKAESFTSKPNFTRRITEVKYDPSQMIDDEDDL